MLFEKCRGLIIAEAVLNAVALWAEEKEFSLAFRVEAFNNCREQGLILYASRDFETKLTVYVYNHRNTDKPTVTFEYCYGDSIYSKEAWQYRTMQFDGIWGAVNFICNLIVSVY